MTTQELDAIRGRLGRLERENRLWRWGALAVVVGAVLLVVGSTPRPSATAAQGTPGVEELGDPQEIYQRLHRIGHRAIGMIDETIRKGAVPMASADTVALWSTRLLFTDIYEIPMLDGRRTIDPEFHLLNANPVQEEARVEALREHLARLKYWEGRFQPLARDGTMSELEFMELQARRMLAEGWLARELQKPVSP